MILIDANILIEVLKNNQSVIKKLSDFSAPLAISSITAMELIVGVRNKRETQMLEQFVDEFQLFHLEPSISVTAFELIKQYA